MPLVVKLKAIALSMGRRLTTDMSSRREDGDVDAWASLPPATTPASRGSTPLTGVLPKVELTPTSAESQRQFARQCTLQAVFDWYQGFLEREGLSEGGSGKPGGAAKMEPAVPGFPQFASQIIEAEPDRVRVRFFDPSGREAGVMLLRSEADRCVIEVPGGPLYVARQAASLPDFTRDGDDSSASTS